jgi:hypothetical protein
MPNHRAIHLSIQRPSQLNVFVEQSVHLFFFGAQGNERLRA